MAVPPGSFAGCSCPTGHALHQSAAGPGERTERSEAKKRPPAANRGPLRIPRQGKAECDLRGQAELFTGFRTQPEMRPVMTFGAQGAEPFGVLMATRPAMQGRVVEGRVVMHMEDRVIVKRPALFAGEPGPRDCGLAGGMPDVRFGPGTAAFGRAAPLAAGGMAATVVAGTSGDRADTGPAVRNGVHNPILSPGL